MQFCDHPQAAEYKRLRDSQIFDMVLDPASADVDTLADQLEDVCMKLGADVASVWDEDLRTPS